MNEDITQEIYYCLIEAGYKENIAAILCGDENLKKRLTNYKEEALLKARKKFTEFYKLIKEPVTELFTQDHPGRH